jgi:hypothetical protein
MIRADQRITAFRLLLALALAVAVTMAILPNPPSAGLSDKTNHIAAFATLALLAALAYPREPLWRIGERLLFLGAMIEVVQSIPRLNRDCDIMDWVVDSGAVVVMLLLVAAVRRARRSATA